MTPDRAQELLNHRTRIGNIEAQTLTVGNIRQYMSAEEIKQVKDYWDTLPGSSSFYTTLLRIAAGEMEESP